MIITISRTHSDVPLTVQLGGKERRREGENLGRRVSSLMIVDIPQVRLVLFHQLVFLVLILHPHLALRNRHNKTCSRKNTRSQHKSSTQEVNTRGQHKSSTQEVNTRGQHKSSTQECSLIV